MGTGGSYPDFPGAPGAVIPVFHGHRGQLPRFFMGTAGSYPGLLEHLGFPWAPGAVIPVFHGHREQLSRFSMDTEGSYPDFPWAPGAVIPVFHGHREQLSRFSMDTGSSYPGLLEHFGFPWAPGAVIPVSRGTGSSYPGFLEHPKLSHTPSLPQRRRAPAFGCSGSHIPLREFLEFPGSPGRARFSRASAVLRRSPRSRIPDPGDPSQESRSWEWGRVSRECRAWAAFLALNPSPDPAAGAASPKSQIPAGHSRLQLRIPWNSVAIKGGTRRGHGEGQCGRGWEPLRCCRGKEFRDSRDSRDSRDRLFQRDPCWECAPGNGNALPPFPASLRGVGGTWGHPFPRGKIWEKEEKTGKREGGGPESPPVPSSQKSGWNFFGVFSPPPLSENLWNFEESMEFRRIHGIWGFGFFFGKWDPKSKPFSRAIRAGKSGIAKGKAP
ncbi:uncharacterized protein LOC128819336 [Vidua macroura]|uniref:uncharacterized protein LOC128819336 n=1 Tax=Vidua macroura TaxID=187451 RepID=UPI0023A84649|nr:uncharacterized protein LOC128819336 [Vidua macroura]